MQWDPHVHMDRIFSLCGEIRCVARKYVSCAVVPRAEMAMMELAPPLMIQHIYRHPCFDLIKETLQLHNHSITQL